MLTALMAWLSKAARMATKSGLILFCPTMLHLPRTSIYTDTYIGTDVAFYINFDYYYHNY